jgi:hypothetical protein
MGATDRFAGYLIAAAAGSLVYTIGAVIALMLIMPEQPPLEEHPILGILRTTLDVCPFVFITAMVTMILPWCLAVWLSRLINRAGAFYFIGTGAAASLIIGCATSALVLQRFLEESRPFFETLWLSAKFQAWLLLLTGIAGGFTYWSVSERRRRLPRRNALPMS